MTAPPPPQLLAIQSFTQGHVSGVQGFDPELSLINHYTSCSWRSSALWKQAPAGNITSNKAAVKVTGENKSLHLKAPERAAHCRQTLPFMYRYNTHRHTAVAFYSETQWMYKLMLEVAPSQQCHAISRHVSVTRFTGETLWCKQSHDFSAVALETLLYKHSFLFLILSWTFRVNRCVFNETKRCFAQVEYFMGCVSVICRHGNLKGQQVTWGLYRSLLINK